MKKWGYSLLVMAALCVCVVCTGCLMLSVSDRAAGVGDAAMQSELRQCVNRLCAEPRFGSTLNNARDYLVRELKEAGWDVRLQAFENDRTTYYNVVAERKGIAAGRYVVGAHYDACDSSPVAVNPGADDNASGVAVLLALARRLPPNPYYTVELVCYACEEPPWFGTDGMGSAHHAASCSPDDVRGMICLEMLGCFRHDGKPGASLFPGSRLILPKEDNYVAVVGDWGSLSLARRAYRALCKRMPAVRVNVPMAHDSVLWFSDHRNYEPRGIASIMITDTSMLRNANYHEATDTPDTLCYNCMALIAEGVIELVRELACNAPR